MASYALPLEPAMIRTRIDGIREEYVRANSDEEKDEAELHLLDIQMILLRHADSTKKDSEKKPSTA